MRQPVTFMSGRSVVVGDELAFLDVENKDGEWESDQPRSCDVLRYVHLLVTSPPVVSPAKYKWYASFLQQCVHLLAAEKGQIKMGSIGDTKWGRVIVPSGASGDTNWDLLEIPSGFELRYEWDPVKILSGVD
ncbi:hypothetical protein J6590_029880 [Homalodisca vitripennis]|nr:hypothetical protein J6590_029880 [Homalodisca vitripennis]